MTSALALAGVIAAVSVLCAGPAAADTPNPQGGDWPAEESVDLLQALLLLGGVPLLVFLVISALVLGPALARGESLAPGQHVAESQWLGGPRKATGELAAPDTEDSHAGGAGGRW